MTLFQRKIFFILIAFGLFLPLCQASSRKIYGQVIVGEIQKTFIQDFKVEKNFFKSVELVSKKNDVIVPKKVVKKITKKKTKKKTGLIDLASIQASQTYSIPL